MVRKPGAVERGAVDGDPGGGGRTAVRARASAGCRGPCQGDARGDGVYQSIEQKGAVDADRRPGVGSGVYGCDDCLAVCPWNKFARAGREQRLAARDDLAAPPLAELAALDQEAFRVRFARSPVKRTGRDLALIPISEPTQPS